MPLGSVLEYDALFPPRRPPSPPAIMVEEAEIGESGEDGEGGNQDDGKGGEVGKADVRRSVRSRLWLLPVFVARVDAPEIVRVTVVVCR